MGNRLFITLISILFSLHLYGGDVATFVNLGFSKDSKYFMFAEYGVKQSTSGSYADLFFVDVPNNSFAPNGKKTVSYNEKTEPGTFGMGSLFNIIEENIALTVKYAIDHTKTGRILYHLLDGQKSKESFTFRDFITGDVYSIALSQSVYEKDKSVKSSFSIAFMIKKPDGNSKSFSVGHPDFTRAGVRGYCIRQILLAPDAKSLIFVIEKEEVDGNGANIRYMTEASKIQF
jgi:predicted secreted protein